MIKDFYHNPGALYSFRSTESIFQFRECMFFLCYLYSSRSRYKLALLRLLHFRIPTSFFIQQQTKHRSSMKNVKHEDGKQRYLFFSRSPLRSLPKQKVNLAIFATSPYQIFSFSRLSNLSAIFLKYVVYRISICGVYAIRDK